MTIYNIYIYQNCNVLGLDGHLHSDLRMWIVILHLEILKGKVLNVFHLPLDVNGWEGTRVARTLLLQRVHVVGINVGVPQSVDKVAGLQPRHVGHHHGEQGVAGNVEGNAKSDIR